MIRKLVEKFFPMQAKVETQSEYISELDTLTESLCEKDRRAHFVAQILAYLNENCNGDDKVRKIIHCIRDFSGIEAIAIRVRKETDFPYYTYEGFSTEFVLAENYLCTEDGHLECMCGAVLEARTDPALPFFTAGGSFWTSSTTELLKDLDERIDFSTRRRCAKEGYESVALVPLRSGADIVGLLQLNDRRPEQFNEELIQFYETLGATLGVALRRMLTEAKLQESEAHYRAMLTALPYMIFRTASDGTVLEVKGQRELFVAPPEDQVGRHLKDTLPKNVAHKVMDKVKECLEGAPEDVTVFEYELPIAGGKRWWEARLVRYTGTKDQVLAVVTDITDRRKKQRRK
jgi:PAS domain S-box-containing protein